jgi:hypothetical protein
MPAAGDFVRASDATELFEYKTATESVISSTAFQNDDDLVLAVEANAVYIVEGLLFYDGATAGDLKITWAVPSGASFDYGHMGAATGITAGTANTVDMRQIVETDSLGVGCAGAGTTLAFPFYGILIVDATAGSLQLQWAQFASSGTATRLFAGSFLRARKMDS